MILIFVSFLMILVLSVGLYLASFNFFGTNLSSSLDTVFQSKIVNQQNLSLFSGYKAYYNSGINDNDSRCYSGGVFEDNNCFFKGLYGFIPPNTVLDLGKFQGISGSGLNISLTGTNAQGGEIFLRGLDGQGIKNFSFSNNDTFAPLDISGSYDIKIKNSGTGRVQYFLSLSGSEGFDYTFYSSGGYAYYSKDFSSSVGGNKILNFTNLSSNSNLTSCSELLSSSPYLLSGLYYVRPSLYPSGITGYCEMTGDGYTWLYDTGGSISKTVLLLQSEAGSGTMGFRDSMGNPYTISVSGTVLNSTGQAKFGKSSIYFSGYNSLISISNSSNFDFGNGDFTMDFWTYGASYVGSTLLSKRPTGSGYGPFHIASGKFRASSNGTARNIINGASFTGSVPTNKRVHWAVSRSGTSIYMFFNGKMTYSTGISTAFFVNTESLKIGSDTNLYSFTGYLEEFRIVKGQALRTGDFTPPSAPYRF